MLDHGVLDDAARPDAHPIAEHDLPFEHDIDVDEDVAAGAYAASDVDSRGVGDARTFVHEGFGETPLVEPLQCRELHAIVDAEHLLEGLRRDGADRHSFLDRKGDDIGEVVLALRVVAAHTLEPTPHVSGTSCEDPRVDLRDVALLVACIPFFDDVSARDRPHPGRFGRIREGSSTTAVMSAMPLPAASVAVSCNVARLTSGTSP